MSHFTVAVFTENGGKTLEELLAPYQENNMDDCPKEYLQFNDVEDEYKNKFENDTRKEFYCSSNSSWGQEINKENYEILKNGNIGDSFILRIGKTVGFTYFKKNAKYRCYYNEKHEYPEEHIWIEVVKVLYTTHSDKDVCFEGTIKVKIINEPKEISLKKYYNNDFEFFMKEWAGYEKDEETGKYGYWENPNRKWDYYQIGGRWLDKLTTKDKNVNSAKVKDVLFENEFSTFAVITPDGKWYEKGEMGWWACVSNEEEEWDIKYKERFIDTANPEWILTVVDCHI